MRVKEWEWMGQNRMGGNRMRNEINGMRLLQKISLMIICEWQMRTGITIPNSRKWYFPFILDHFLVISHKIIINDQKGAHCNFIHSHLCTVNIILSHSCTVNIFWSCLYIKNTVHYFFMFVSKENEQGILFITIDYHSIPLISLIFYTNRMFLMEQDNTEIS